jgi:hypothetical protein
MFHHKVWPYISEYDQAMYYPTAMLDQADHWSVFDEDCNFHGFFRIDHITSQVKEIHTVLLPSAVGPIAKCAREQFYCFLGQEYGNCTLITKVPECNRLALKYATDGGMKEYATIRNGWMSKNGFCDLILLSRKVGE